MSTMAVVVVPPPPSPPESSPPPDFEPEPPLLSRPDVNAGVIEEDVEGEEGEEGTLADDWSVGDVEPKKAEYVKGTLSQPTYCVFPPS